MTPGYKASLWEWIVVHAKAEDASENDFIDAFVADDEMRPWMKYKDMKRNLKSRGEFVGEYHFEVLKTLRKRWKIWKRERTHQ
jgi:hypothetical protein